jgi:hypothetical protein
MAYIENLPVDALLYGAAGNPPTVEQMYALATKTIRTPLSSVQVRHRPDPGLVDSFKGDLDSPFTRGTGATATTMSGEGKRFNPTMIGFVWMGVPSNQLSFDFVQNIEWRPDIGNGLVSAVPKTIREPGYIDKLLKYLDDHKPGWTTEEWVGGAARVANSVFSLSSQTRRLRIFRGPRQQRIEL